MCIAVIPAAFTASPGEWAGAETGPLQRGQLRRLFIFNSLEIVRTIWFYSHVDTIFIICLGLVEF